MGDLILRIVMDAGQARRLIALCAVLGLLLGPGISYGQYGGPYPIVEAKAGDKIAEFDAMRAYGWDSAKVAQLNRSLFLTSIKDNRWSNFPYADAYQRYNYVVKDGKIFVAVWTKDGTLRQVCKRAPHSDPAYLAAKIKAETMVNFFPEDVSLPNSPSSPLALLPKACESTTPSGAKTGVLDGHSKHFMIVQGLPTELKNYTSRISPGITGSGVQWATRPVAYAGEIIVDVQKCYYVINQGSGTYQPKGGNDGDFSFLAQVATLFAGEVGTPPAVVWDRDTKRLIPTTAIPANGTPLECGRLDLVPRP